MSNIDNKIKELNIILPDAKAPVGSYVAARVSGKITFYIRSNFNGLLMGS